MVIRMNEPKSGPLKRIMKALPEPRLIVRAIIDALALVRPMIRDLPSRWKVFYDQLENEPSTRYKTAAWAISLIFVAIIFLSASNPFRLLVPGLAFSIPVRDQRVNVTVYAPEQIAGILHPHIRKIAPETTVESRTISLAYLISRPMGLRENPGSAVRPIMPFPQFGLAIRRVWTTKKGSSLLLDLRKSTLGEEFRTFQRVRLKIKKSNKEKNKKKTKKRNDQDRNDAAIQQTRLQIMDEYFRALTATILADRKKTQTVFYLLDGNRKSIKGMKFDLSLEHTRQDTKSEKIH